MIFRPPRSVPAPAAGTGKSSNRSPGRCRMRLSSSALGRVRSSSRTIVVSAAMVVVTVAGCGEPPDMRDQRLAEFARDAMTTQKQQNDRIAEQSKAVVDESRQLAEAARDLVRNDSQALREMVEAHAALAAGLDRQRSDVDAARDRLEREHREIAHRRSRDPVIARAVESVGLSLLCLLPVAVCLFVIRQMGSGHADDTVVAQLLTVELARSAPKLLAPAPVPVKVPAIEDASVKRPSSGGRDSRGSPTTGAQASAVHDAGFDHDDDPDGCMGQVDFPDDFVEDDDFGPEAFPWRAASS